MRETSNFKSFIRNLTFRNRLVKFHVSHNQTPKSKKQEKITQKHKFFSHTFREGKTQFSIKYSRTLL
jgi:hypothetical protein